jgi:multiple sugar transport system permease protein
VVRRPRGLFQVIASGLGLVDVSSPPASLTGNGVMGLSWWEWLSGPSVALLAVVFLVVWTTAGTFMLMFLAALQDIPLEVEEAARLDGVGPWQKFRFVTLPQLKPVLFLVLTLGLIGTWQVFDQVYLLGGGNPAKTTLTPAFLSYKTGFRDFDYGNGAAIAFMLFLIIIAMTLLQRYVLRDKDAIAEKARPHGADPHDRGALAASSSGTDVTGTGAGGVGR